MNNVSDICVCLFAWFIHLLLINQQIYITYCDKDHGIFFFFFFFFGYYSSMVDRRRRRKKILSLSWESISIIIKQWKFYIAKNDFYVFFFFSIGNISNKKKKQWKMTIKCSAQRNQDARKRCWTREWNEKWPKHQRKKM